MFTWNRPARFVVEAGLEPAMEPLLAALIGQPGLPLSRLSEV